jgi:deoxyadenosine/deoxycytidine kinase
MFALEGNMGKTTLATKIAEDFNAKTVLERRQSLSTKVL